MKSIITLSGRGNIGKSATIRNVYESLVKQYLDHETIHVNVNTDREISVVLKIGRKCIGIESRGDTRERVEDSLQMFLRYKCKIIVCATRTRGGSYDAVDEFAAMHKLEICRIKKIAEVETSQYTASNRKYARQIVKTVRLNGL